MINFLLKHHPLNSRFPVNILTRKTRFESNAVSSFIYTVSHWYLFADMAGHTLVVAGGRIAVNGCSAAGLGPAAPGQAICL
jgi:hypothetical protein